MYLRTWGGRAKLGRSEGSIDIHTLLNVKWLVGSSSIAQGDWLRVLCDDLEWWDREGGREA